MTIHCITFDLDNTLWSIEPVIERAEEKFYRWLGDYCPAITTRFSQRQLTAQRRVFYQGFPHNSHNLSWLRRRWLQWLFAEHGCAGLDVEAAFQYYWQHRNDVELFADARETLESLSSAYTIGAITNGNASVEMIGIDHYFDFVISSECVGVAKPGTEIFAAAVVEAGVLADQVAHIGDDPRTDVLGAGAAGLRTIWYNPPLTPWPGGRTPDAVVRSLAEIHTVIDHL